MQVEDLNSDIRIKEELDSIGDMLIYGQVNGDLQIEIIWSAMKYLQNNAGSTIQDACSYGINEWDK